MASDVWRVREAGQSMGLVLNVGKCEVIAHPGCRVDHVFLSSFQQVSPDNATLLGAPLSHGEALDTEWKNRCDDLTRASNRLKLIGSQQALLLLRAAFGAPRVQHILRESPSANHQALSTFDNIQRSSLNSIINSELTEVQWLQATLPIKDGGLGVRRVSSLAISAFMASASSTLNLQNAILSKFPCPTDLFADSSLASWVSAFGLPPPAPMSCKQSAWDRPGIVADRGQVQANVHTPREKAVFLASLAAHSGDWLSALPIASCGLHLDNDAVRVAVAMRLGLNVCMPHPCHCGAQVDAWGYHAFTCKKAQGRIARHQALNDVIARSLSTAGIPVMKEPLGLARTDGKRPDGLTLVPWSLGKALTWDVTVATTLAESYIVSSSRSAGAAAEHAAIRKTDKYSQLPACYIFQPIALETLGAINTSAIEFLSEVGKRISQISGEPRATQFLFQRLSVGLQRYNSILLYQSFVAMDEPDL